MRGNTATILQGGNIVSIAEDDLRKGDLLFLQAGDLVPADLRLVEARGLVVDEWELTGELLPKDKRVDSEEVNLYRGSTITRGDGLGVVVATGEETEYGGILEQSQALQKRNLPNLLRLRYFILPVLLLPPLLVSLSHGNAPLIAVLALSMALALVLLQNDALFRHLLVSHGAERIERANIRIRDRTSLDVIPRLDLVCLDKTGVLTTRDLSVKRIYFMDGMSDTTSPASAEPESMHLASLACALCNDVFVPERVSQANLIDKAMIEFAVRNGVDLHDTALRYTRTYDKPFDSEDRYMVSGFQRDDQRLFFAKGDPDVIWKMCRAYVAGSGAEKEMTWASLEALSRTVSAISRGGDVAIALAYGSGILDAPPNEYTFLCLVHLENPLQQGVPDLVARLREARIGAVMLTGDRPEVALAVGKKAGIGPHPEYCLTGGQIEAMALSEVARQSEYVSIFARLLPSQKGVLIRLFQQAHKVVAMVGDGANDVVALKAADVAISFVDDSSPLAKRVSDILISDLSDLSRVIQESAAIKRQIGSLLFLRDIAVLSMFAAWYAWNLRSLLTAVSRIWGPG